MMGNIAVPQGSWVFNSNIHHEKFPFEALIHKCDQCCQTGGATSQTLIQTSALQLDTVAFLSILISNL